MTKALLYVRVYANWINASKTNMKTKGADIFTFNRKGTPYIYLNNRNESEPIKSSVKIGQWA